MATVHKIDEFSRPIMKEKAIKILRKYVYIIGGPFDCSL
jgi:hypothetical protein